LAVKIKLKIKVTSDFHLGTGTGRGRATDAVVLTDDDGVPYISGSTIKGLCRWQACRLIDCFPGLGPKPIVPESDEDETASGQARRRPDPEELRGPAFEIFGGGSERRYAEQRVWFDHASVLPNKHVRHLTRSGRSARDRRSGRARDKHLFFYEDAGPAVFTTDLTCDDDLSREALLLLVLSLRRIEALGGQRRRGKGQCECTVKIVDPGRGDELADLKGLTLPGQNDDEARRFQDFATPILEGARNHWCRSETTSKLKHEETPSDDTAARDDFGEGDAVSAGSAAQPAVWLLFAVARSPLTLGHEQAIDNTVASEDFISGASLRGALAWQAIRDGLDPNGSLFQDVFVREGVQFGPLYPASSRWNSGTPMSMPFPIPASFCTCKRFPGSKANATTSRADGLADRMWHAGEECDYCQAPTKQADGYLQLVGTSSNAQLSLGRPAMRVFQRTAIDEITQRGADNQLFGLESVPHRTQFAGYVWGNEALLQQALGRQLDRWTTIRVGKAKSRGQGVVDIFMRKAPDPHHVYPHLQSFVATPTDAGSESDSAVAGQTGVAAEGKDQTFYVTMYSDLIAVDEYLRPVTMLTANLLWWLMNQPGKAPFEIEKGFVGTRRIGGYLGVVGLPRTPDIAITAGSTWRLRWKDPSDNVNRSAAWEALRKAEQSGLGLRRGEGFGRIVLNHPVHLARWNNMTLPSQSPEGVVFAVFPDRETGSSPPAPDRSQQLAVELAASSTGKGDRAYQRLFAELAQAENPLDAIQQLYDKYRENKAKDIAHELERVAGERLTLFNHEHGQTTCIAKQHASDPNKVKLMREALKKHSGETLDHV
jgi:CRISPR-associated protein Csx10